MARLQRSFFDKTKQYRRRRPRFHAPPSARQLKVGPPVTISSQSKAKLKSYRFVGFEETSEMESNENKENEVIADENGKPEHRACLPPIERRSVTAKEALLDVPQTPTGRVPLADLIANGEEVSDQLPILTPVERVLWNHSPLSMEGSSLMTPATARSRKRARSSSPPSSSKEARAQGPAGSISGHPSHSLLKTPQADPAGDLWSRYKVSTKCTPEKPSASAAPDFMHSSTPHIRALAHESGLRRTMSCGVEWPISAHKRRKMHKTGSRVTESSPAPKEVTKQGAQDSRTSRISFLLEQIHGGLSDGMHGQEAHQDAANAEPKVANEDTKEDESEAIIEETNEALNEETNGKTMEAPKEELPSAFETDKLPIDDVDEVPQDAKRSSFLKVHEMDIKSSSEFGGASFDLDMLALETNMKTKTRASEELNLEETHLDQQDADDEKADSNLSMAESDDEFADEDEDQADMELVAAMYDQSSTPPDIQEPRQYSQHDFLLSSSFPTTRPPQRKESRVEILDAPSDDEFGGLEEFEEYANQLSLSPTHLRPAEHALGNEETRTLQRYLIIDIGEGTYVTEKGREQSQKILSLKDEKTKERKSASLRQSWQDSPCAPGMYVHIIGQFSRGECVISDSQNMLILNPDYLLSATVVADSFSCLRRAVLQDRVKATNEANEAQVYGHILHEVFQEALKANRWDTKWFEALVTDVALRYLETLFEINVDSRMAFQRLMSKVPELQSWAELFVSAKPRSDAIVRDRNGTQAMISVNKLLDVEEHVWSPQYGLKGNIDATVQILMDDGGVERTLTVPLEVKTGKNTSNASHRAQTALYTLLLSDRYDIDIACGILYYMETSEVIRVSAIRHEMLQMIKQRNELAVYVRHRRILPPMLRSQHLCGKCYAKVPCFVYHRLAENGDGETSGLKEKFDEVIQHLKPGHAEFFSKWDDLLTKEESDMRKFRRELWTMTSQERERVGRCFGGVVIESGSAVELTDAPKINRFKYTFVKQALLPHFTFTDSQITIGEPIVISDEKGHFALANGYVTNVSKKRISVAVDRRLHCSRIQSKNFHAETNQSFSGIMKVNATPSLAGSFDDEIGGEAEVVYRLDKDEFSNGMATVRNNLIRVMEKNLFGAQALRKLVIDGVAPTFVPGESCLPRPLTASQASLNVDQKRAIEKVMSARDYALVLGMPGTGKTTTIAHIIRALAAQGKSILLTSYTHTAVDNILLKIRDDGIAILRLGVVAKVHPQVQEFADLGGIPKTTADELKQSYASQVVATTCLGINHPIFNQRIFDYCIVDEASQITLPVCLGPIRMARTFILVGDHYQLPPLVQSRAAQEGGLDVSLFKLLSEQHPASVVNLEHQYRMCEEIMLLSNSLIYAGRLKCGTEKVSKRSIIIPQLANLRNHHYSALNLPSSSLHVCLSPNRGSCWIRDVLDPSTKVVFINTDTVLPLSLEIAKGSRITNPIEVALATQIVMSLLTVGIAASDIGVITLYRSQLALLKQNLRRTSEVQVEMHTADRFQGRDKEAIVLSLVRSNSENHVGDLLKDWRRVNVALTRARTKLIVLGSWSTMKAGNELLKQFCAIIDEHGWRVDMKPHWLASHVFAEEGTQPSMEVKEEMTLKKSPVKGKVGARTLTKNRPVMRDVLNEVMPSY